MSHGCNTRDITTSFVPAVRRIRQTMSYGLSFFCACLHVSGFRARTEALLEDSSDVVFLVEKRLPRDHIGQEAGAHELNPQHRQQDSKEE